MLKKLFLIFILVIVSSAQSIVIHVPRDYATIQEAINASNDGDTILVAPGDYDISSSITNDRVNNLHLIGSREEDGSDASVIEAVTPNTYEAIKFLNVSGCTIAGFEIKNAHSGIVLETCNTCRITRNYVHDNDEDTAWHGEGIAVFHGENIEISFNVVDHNEFHQISLGYGTKNIRVINNTVLQTYAYDGITLGLDYADDITIKNNIIAYNREEGIEILSTPQNFFHDYNCFWQNGKGPIQTTFAEIGEHSFVADPLLVDMQNHNYFLQPNSPCLGAGENGANIGALGVAGSSYGIVSVSDVQNDQGKQVRVVWNKSEYDRNNDVFNITHYCLWRKMSEEILAQSSPSFKANIVKVSKRSEMFAIGGKSAKPNIYHITASQNSQSEYWDFIATVTAHHFDHYSCVVPTCADSTADGIPWSVFLVSAHTFNPDIFFDTPPDSGYSIDNLAPSAPQNVILTEQGDGTEQRVQISWDAVPEKDFSHYAIYKGTESNFDPSTVQSCETTTDTFWVDMNIEYGQSYYYKISAFDFSGNQSNCSEECSIMVKVQDTALFPKEYSLSQNYPNPFNPTTTINYELPETAHVVIKIFNSAGQEVKTLTDDNMLSGYHTVQWDGKDENNAKVVSGLYFYQIHAGDYTCTKKMAILK